MASGNAITRALESANIASPVVTGTGAGFVACPGPLSFGNITATGVRSLRDAPAGHSMILVNTSGSQVVLADSVPNTVATLEDNEAALCVSTGDAAYPWISVVLKTNAT